MKPTLASLLTACLFAIALPALADLACQACSEAISGRYLTLAGQAYCSRECLHTALPRCHACASPVERGLQIGDRVYCERHASGPTCSHCRHPAPEPELLPDGRVLCPDCARASIGTSEQAQRLYRRAAASVEAITGLRLGDPPPLQLVSREELLRQGDGLLTDQSQGLYRCDRNWTTVDGRRVGPATLSNARISLLTHLSPGDFEAAAVHELTHHLLALHFPRAEEEGPNWLREGVAEYIAAISLRRDGRAELADRLRGKGPPYGNGLRWMQWRFGDDDWPNLRRWLTTTNPARLPSEPER